MAYDERLADRVRALLTGERQVAKKAMFGRRMFMVAGNLAVGVAGDELMVRVGVKSRHAALSSRTRASATSPSARCTTGCSCSA